MQSILNIFVTASETPHRSWPERGHQAMGYICTYTPEEIVHSAGFTPVRIRTGPELPAQAEAHLQSFTCALCRSALHQALRGDLAFLSGLVFPHTCDTLQVLADIWRENFPDLFVTTVVQPLNLSSPSARPYLMAELQRFRQNLAEFSGQPISDDSLRVSIRLHNETRQLLSQLDSQRSRLTARGFYAVVEASMVMPKEQFNPLAAELVELLSEKAPRQKGPRLVLVGPVLDDPTVLDIIDDLGAYVVSDDLCTGSRYFDQPVAQAEEGDPIEALADRHLKRCPCPTKHSLHFQRGEHLLELIEERKADGLVFTLQKFCDPHAFDYAIVKETLDAAGVPHLLLELEHTPAVGQLRTRLEAFLEMLKA
ncbi:MAG: 2-hydroxyacyl-CoA dehydratase subunit D [Anaerolineae bacterium]